MVKEVDDDGDGSIGFEEFCQLVADEVGTQGYVSPTVAVSSTAMSPAATSSMSPTEVADATAAIAGTVAASMQAGSVEQSLEEQASEEASLEFDSELVRFLHYPLLAQH